MNRLKVHTIISGKLYQRGKFMDFPLKWKLSELKRLGVSVVVNLCPTPDILLKDAIPHYYHLPIPDSIVKNAGTLLSVAKEVAQLIRQGKGAIVHCNAGRNRSGLLNALLCMELLDMSGEKAIEYVRKRRPNALANEHFVEFLMKQGGEQLSKNKIIVVLGASGSGKTTYIEKNIIAGAPLFDETCQTIPVSVNHARKLMLFGKYNIDNRCKGCDTLSMSIINDLLVTLEYILHEGKWDTIVMDGDRINNEKMLNFLSSRTSDVEVVYVDTPLDIIFKRLPKCNQQFVKTTHTKTRNNIKKMLKMGFNIRHIKTEAKRWFA